MSYSYKSDYTDSALALAMAQYAGKTDFEYLLSAFVDEIQTLGDQLSELASERYLDGAEGIQLDRLGEIVDEPRGGKTDFLYLAYLEARILANRSNGTPDEVLAVARLVLDAMAWTSGSVDTTQDLALTNVYPAAVYVYFWGVGSDATTGATSVETRQLFLLCLEAIAAGIHLVAVVSDRARAETFTFDGSSSQNLDAGYWADSSSVVD